MDFTPARYFDELIRPLDDVPDPEPVPGVTIAPWPDDRDDEILGVTTLAFADHWGSTPTEADSWQQQVRGFGARPISASSPSTMRPATWWASASTSGTRPTTP